VVHASAGMAALASVFYVGKRNVIERGPHSIPLVALGTGLLWFGWYGFNAGSEFKVDTITATAFLNTDVSASFAAITWLFLAWILEKKPKFVGFLTGSVAGLATITPAAGFVTTANAALIGVVSGIVCYYAVALKNKLKWDDALDVWGVHGVGGVLGVIMLGLLATKAVNPMVTVEGLFIGGSWEFFIKEVVSVLAVGAYCFFFSYLMLKVINLVTPVKVTKEEEEAGMDASLHGEIAYEQD
ncbi:MAG: ammonium transporter, partial [Ignavibacteria bacterium]|nr:ammonium transporter [Ignavibacteria bacterium]